MLAARDATNDTRVLVLGASGMLGHALMYELSGRPHLDVRGTVRALSAVPSTMRGTFSGSLEVGVDLLDDRQRVELLNRVAPDVVINAIGVIKQDPLVVDTINTVRVNALLPHLLADQCHRSGIRFIHVSTDCVFSGRKGGYAESDVPDPVDFYGRSKLLGETDLPPALTLRTSIVGRELRRHGSLVDWFLQQPETTVRGFTGAIYSGVTTVEFARMIADVVIPDASLSGLFHVASEPITKFDLLRLVANTFNWKGTIEPDADFRCDRSLTADPFAAATGYRPPPWWQMIGEMKTAGIDWSRRDKDEHLGAAK